MKTIFKILFMAVLVISINACQSSDSGETTTGGEVMDVSKNQMKGSTQFGVDGVVSHIGWTGRKIVGNDYHKGKIKISDGTFYVKDGELAGGNFTIDMTSLEVNDLEAGNGKEKLEGHLKDTDFFEVATYPTASFEIATVTPVDTIGGASHIIAGNLQIKDITKGISFPARVVIDESGVLSTSIPFTINRTEWGVNYNSTLVGALKDKAISDDVNIALKIRSSKAEEVQ